MEDRTFKKVDNSSFKERFQFTFSINENVICQRYFRINGFNYSSIETLELKEVMDECVAMIQKDLVEKSRVYMWYTNNDPIKMTGFVKTDNLTSDDVAVLTNGVEGCTTLSDGQTINKTYFDYDNATPSSQDYVDERPDEGEFVFKFAFLIDDKKVYEKVWDGNIYPKYVRNSVDLSNSDALYRGKEPSSLSFALAIVYHMTNGKQDLLYHMIKKICDTLSNSYSEKYEYTKKEKYGDKTYHFTTYNRDYVDGWRKAVNRKTNDYFNHMYPTQGQIDFINKYL